MANLIRSPAARLNPIIRAIDRRTAALLTLVLLGALSLLLSDRWPILPAVYGLLVAVPGLPLAITGDAIPRLLASRPRRPAAYRLTGVFLLAWGGFFVFFRPPPYRLLNTVAIGFFAAIMVIVVLAIRRRPELSPFTDSHMGADRRA